jgi:colicin import membrane protein
MLMARVCKKCGERLFPTDTFCGFCGEPVEDANLNLGALGGGPRPLVGDDALTSEERSQIDNLKAKYAYEAKLKAEQSRRAARTQKVSETRKMTAAEMAEKKAKILAAKKQEEKRLEAERLAAEQRAAEAAARKAEAEQRAAEEAAARKAEAEQRAAEEAAARKAEAEQRAAEEAAARKAEAEQRAAEEEAKRKAEAARKAEEEERLAAERRAAEAAARKAEEERLEKERLEAEHLERLAAERRAAEEEAARLEAEAKRLEEERLEAERLEKEHLEAERLEKERLEAERLERLAAERRAAEEEAARLEAEAKRLEEEAGLYAEGNASEEADEALAEEQDNSNSEANAYQPSDEYASEALDDIMFQDETEDEPLAGASWEEADKRAREEQENEDRVIRRKRINEGSDHLTRDIVALVIGILILVVLLAFLLRDEIKGLTGNDSERLATPNVATATTADATDTTTPTEALVEEYTLSDAFAAWDGSIAEMFIQGTGEESSPYLLTTGSELAYLASEVNRGVNFADSYFELANDIDLSGMEWTPIGYYYEGEEGSDLVYSFNGHFDGKGYKISNYTVSTLENARLLTAYSDNNVCGLFGATYGAVISNLTIENADLEITKEDNGEIMAGLLAGCTYDTTISDCQVTGTITVTANNRICAGTAIGAAYNTTFAGVSVSGVISTSSLMDVNDSGILCGFAKESSASDITLAGGVTANGIGNVYCGGAFGYGTEISSEGISGEVSVTALTESEAAYVMAGGAFGYYVTGTDNNINLKSIIDATGTDYLYAGGIYGYADSVDAADIVVSATITANAVGGSSTVNAGGIAGGINSGSLAGNEAAGSISSSATEMNYTGGIAGNSTSTEISSIDTTVNTNATATDSASAIVMCGGICGSNTDGKVSAINASGSVTAVSSFDVYSGGAFGYISGGAYETIAATGDMTSTSIDGVSAGGIVGYQSGTVPMTDCTGSKNRTNDGKNVYDSDTAAITK